ncbi:MAG: hypothetical protein WCW44_03030 [archaeon]|jgi:hypothetical protein
MNKTLVVLLSTFFLIPFVFASNLLPTTNEGLAYAIVVFGGVPLALSAGVALGIMLLIYALIKLIKNKKFFSMPLFLMLILVVHFILSYFILVGKIAPYYSFWGWGVFLGIPFYILIIIGIVVFGGIDIWHFFMNYLNLKKKNNPPGSV